MRRVSQDQLELTLQYVPHRLPVDPRRFHRHVRAARVPQPVPELQELRGGGRPAPHLAAHLTALSHPQTPDHRLFVNIQTGAALMDDFHYRLLRHAAGAKPSSSNSTNRARERCRPWPQSRVLAGPRVKLTLGLRAPGKIPTSVPAAQHPSLSSFIHQGGKSPCATNTIKYIIGLETRRGRAMG